MKIVFGLPYSQSSEVIDMLIPRMASHVTEVLKESRGFGKDARIKKIKKDKHFLAFSLKGHRVELSVHHDRKGKAINFCIAGDEVTTRRAFVEEFRPLVIESKLRQWFIPYFSPKPKKEAVHADPIVRMHSPTTDETPKAQEASVN